MSIIELFQLGQDLFDFSDLKCLQKECPKKSKMSIIELSQLGQNLFDFSDLT